jgi:hypothetical protein
VHPPDEDLNVVEHLGEDEVRPCVDFLLEAFQLEFELGGGQGDVLGEAGDGDVEVVAVFAADVSDEVDAVDEAPLDGLPFAFTVWWVTSEGEDIATPGLLSGLKVVERSIQNFTQAG